MASFTDMSRNVIVLPDWVLWQSRQQASSHMNGCNILGETKTVPLLVDYDMDASIGELRATLAAFLRKSFPPITTIWSDQELGLV